MNEHPFHRVVLICDAACDIRVAVADAASLAARWGAALHGIYIDDENLHRFAALPFGQYVSLSSAAITDELSAGNMASLTSALGAAMRRALAEVAKARGLQWTFGTIRDLPSAALVLAQDGDILVVEAAARTFSGAWRPRAAWEKSPAAFSGTVLMRGRGRRSGGILILLPDDARTREKVLAAAAALAIADGEIIVAGQGTILADAEAAIDQHFPAARHKHVKTLLLDKDRSALGRLLARDCPAIIILSADDAAEWLEGAEADILLVR
jgi:hypothetical protein